MDWQHQELGNIIGVQAQNCILQGDDLAGSGFEDGENFRVVLDLALPLVDRLDRRHQIDTGRESLLDDVCANLTRHFDGGKGDHDHPHLSAG